MSVNRSPLQYIAIIRQMLESRPPQKAILLRCFEESTACKLEFS